MALVSKVRQVLAVMLIGATLFWGAWAQAKHNVGDVSEVLGVWTGESKCVARGTACNDEDAMYRLARREGTPPGWVTIDFGKIVDGKPVSMGVLDCEYTATKRTLRCSYSRGVWLLTVSATKMQGTLTLPDKTILRRVSLTKQEGSEK